MRQSVTKQLYAYWNRLKGARSAPERSEIDPAEIRDALADSFILEVDSRERFPIRLCGTRLDALWLSEQKGKSFLDLWREEDRRALSSVMLTVVDGVTPVVAGAEGTVGDGLEPLDLELLLLPLRHFGKTHARVLGALTPSHQPHWLGLAPAGPLRLKSFRVVAANETRMIPLGVAALRPRIAAGRPQLVLYRGGKA
jgi:hypothetical protein